MSIDRAASGVRSLMVLKWIDALESGYGEHNGVIQPATTSNLAYFCVRDDAMKDRLLKNYSEMEIREPINKDVLQTGKSLVQSVTRYLYGRAVIRFEKVNRNEANHISLREGPGQRPWSGVRRYRLNQKGRRWMENYEDKMQRKIKTGKNSPMDFETDTIRWPEKDGAIWKMKELTIPRIEDGKCLETGKSVTAYV